MAAKSEQRKRIGTSMEDGNAAYDIYRLHSAAPELDQPLEPVKERVSDTQMERAKRKRPQVVLRPQQRIVPTAIAGFVLVALLAVGVLSSYIQLNSVYADTVAAQSHLTQLENTYAKLAAEDEEVFDSETLNKAAEEAGLVKPSVVQQVYLELAAPDSVVIYNKTETASPLRSCWNSIVEFFGSIGEYFN